jgi:DNA-binding NarL/FixJ family response regulator
LLADDHALVVEGFRKLLEPHFEIVGAVENGRDLLEVAPKVKPHVILLDISMPLLNGIDAARQLRKTVPEAKIVFLSMHDDREYVTEAFRAGASGYLVKRAASSELVSAIQEVLKGRFYVTPLVTRGVIDGLIEKQRRGQKQPPSPRGLTPRQREVLQLIAEGKTNKEAASILNISVKTVEYHKSHIMRELGVRSTAELTKYAIAKGIVSA